MKIDFLRILAFINITLIFIIAIYFEGFKNTLFALFDGVGEEIRVNGYFVEDGETIYEYIGE